MSVEMKSQSLHRRATASYHQPDEGDNSESSNVVALEFPQSQSPSKQVLDDHQEKQAAPDSPSTRESL